MLAPFFGSHPTTCHTEHGNLCLMTHSICECCSKHYWMAHTHTHSWNEPLSYSFYVFVQFHSICVFGWFGAIQDCQLNRLSIRVWIKLNSILHVTKRMLPNEYDNITIQMGIRFGVFQTHPNENGWKAAAVTAKNESAAWPQSVTTAGMTDHCTDGPLMTMVPSTFYTLKLNTLSFVRGYIVRRTS